jgi:hypothetical protein
MATGSPGTNGVWQYGEDDSEATFSALLNKAASTTDTAIGLDRARLDNLEEAGRIVQVKQSYKTDAFTTAGTTFVDVTGLSVTITPQSVSNKILVRVFGYLNGKAASVTARSRLVDGSGTVLGGSTVVGSRTSGIVSMTSGGVTDNNNTLVLEYLHSPNTTSAYTYKLQISADNANTIWFGRTELDPNTAGNVRGVSSITVMEIAG